ncbi:MAG: 3-isopropylmalate dehydratase, partial [Crenarchaeota archaeon]|nr:3-isopropylmalate dehydratase [Thermoproteota archaeon]
GVEERFQPLPERLLEILAAGGIVEYIRKTGRLPW